MRLAKERTGIEVQGMAARRLGEVTLPAGTEIHRITPIGHDERSGDRIYRVEALVGGSWRVFHLDREVEVTMTIRVPTRFIDDHYDRGLPTPEDCGDAERSATIRADDPALPCLLGDAEYYASPSGPDAAPAGVVASAKATVRAIRNVIGWQGCPANLQYLRTSGAVILRNGGAK